jgi:hypothetical protein
VLASYVKSVFLWFVVLEYCMSVFTIAWIIGLDVIQISENSYYSNFIQQVDVPSVVQNMKIGWILDLLLHHIREHQYNANRSST